MLNSSNQVIPSDVFCANEQDQNDCTLFFKAELINNVFTYFKIVESQDDSVTTLNQGETISFDYGLEDGDELQSTIANQTYSFDNGRSLSIFDDGLHGFSYNDGSTTHEFTLSYKHYRSYAGPNQPSGAYIFRPDNYTINGSLLYNIPRYAKVFVGENLIQITVNPSFYIY